MPLVIVSKVFDAWEIFKKTGTSVHIEMRSARCCENPSNEVNELSIQFLVLVHTNLKDKSSSILLSLGIPLTACKLNIWVLKGL